MVSIKCLLLFDVVDLRFIKDRDSSQSRAFQQRGLLRRVWKKINLQWV